jgi:type I restriction enzyme S subunit
VRHIIHSRLNTTVQATLNLGDVAQLPILLPPTREREAIAHILGTLDDKIELNRRMNETLEAMARALFKSWFVDFDPVRAKAEGRDIGLPKDLADVFPDELVESELGGVPKGWGVRSLDGIARFLNGLALQNFRPTDGRSLPVIKIAQLRAKSTDGADLASADLEPDYIVEDGDVLFSWSGSLECALWAGGPGALNQHLFKVTSTDHPKWFYYLWIHEHLGDFRQIAAGKATTMGHIQRHHLSDAKVVVPGQGVLDAANKILDPVIVEMVARRVQSRTLAALRDTLLPKLISGELRIKDANLFVERAA